MTEKKTKPTVKAAAVKAPAPKKPAAAKAEELKKKPAAVKAPKASATVEAKTVKKPVAAATKTVSTPPPPAVAPAVTAPASRMTPPQAVKAPAVPTTSAPVKPSAPVAAPVAPKPPAPVGPLAASLSQISASKAQPVVQKPAPPARPAATAPVPSRPAPMPARPSAPAAMTPPPAPLRPVQPAPVAAQPPQRPAAPPAPQAPPALKAITLATPVTVRDLAAAMEQKPTDVIARMIKMGTMASLNQFLQFESAAKIAKEFGYELEQPHALEKDLSTFHRATSDQSKMVARAPIVTFMGHVDHGKTSLLDAIRKTKVVDTESGGITQHIGAYEIFTEKGAVTFLDTPGHEAFTAMRARGARCTDIVVLVIAADASIQPQTEEAIDHALAAEATVVVAINKCDLPNANVDRVKKDLAEHNLASEDWGGQTITVPVSAKTGQGIDQLLEMLLLEAELLELKADPTSPARGTVVEAELSRSSGPTATFLVQDGTLRTGDTVVCGSFYGKIRAMINEHGRRVPEAPPSAPVRVLGLSGVPSAGDVFYAVKDEVKAREWITERLERDRNKNLAGLSHITLDALYAEIKAGKLQTLKLILKADVQGSAEALKVVIGQIPTNKIKLSVIHTGTGDVTHSDVMLAAASNAVIVGFHVNTTVDAQETAKREEVDVRLYQIIYEAKAAIEKALEGMLEPEKREVLEGFECGISIDNFVEFEPGDEIRVLEVEMKAQTLKS